jgi:uncharacterized protein (DUF1501 family)
MPSRRIFLRSFLGNSALALAGFGPLPGWLGRAAFAAGAGRPRKVLVAIFQRGAADGLNIVVPHGDLRYYALRPAIAIPRKDAIDLDGFFGLHPALAGLKPAFDEGRLAVVHAAGSPDPTRSHFDAQDYMESGTPGLKATRDGWMNRALGPAEGKPSPVRAVSMGPALARAMRGANSAVAVNRLADFKVRDAGAAGMFESMYAQSADAKLHGAGKDTFEAVALLESLEKQPCAPANGAEYPRSRLGESLRQIAQLIKAGAGLEVAFADTGGWDHHANEVAGTPTEGQLANLLADFGKSLGAFARDLGDGMEDVALVTMSEFGRTARENGARGTDHGHANCMFVMGGSTRGGKVYGKWPGLGQEQLYEGRDLAVTTDFRDVLGELVARHLGRENPDAVFPGYGSSPGRWRGLMA